MPEISRFLGIIIYMYFNDHNPAHFHVKYNEHRASVSIDNFAVIDGYLPPRVLGLVIEWAEIHKNELSDNWNNLQKTGNYDKIQPLV